MKNKAILLIMFFAVTFVSAQNGTEMIDTINRADLVSPSVVQSFMPKPRQLRKVYNSIYISPSVNWFSAVSRPFIREKPTVTLIPTWLIDVRVGLYSYISTGISYNSLGCILSFPDEYIDQYKSLGLSSSGIVYRSYHLSYIEIPITFKMVSNYIGRWAFHGDIGARIGMKVRAKAEDVYTDFKYTNPTSTATLVDGELRRDISLGNTVNFLNVAASIRGGAQFYLGTYASLVMGIEYRYGFTPILNAKSTQSNGVYSKVKSQQFALTLGFVF
ncbi:MAG: outer membrane beta-barrel protein [Bacteroidales bacterium]